MIHHYDRDNVLELCSRSHRLTTSLARKVGMPSREVDAAEQGLHLMAEKLAEALCDRCIYTVTVVRCLHNNSLEPENILTTPIAWEALRLRDDFNQDNPLLGAKQIAQVIRREVMPRRWAFWAQASEDEVHLRCQLTNARAVLRFATPDLLARLYSGKTLAQDRSIYLQSERIEVTLSFTSTQHVNVTQGGGHIVTHDVKVCRPVVGDLDINDSSELTLDTHAGVVARFPIKEGTLMLPANLAKSLRMDGTVLPLWDCGTGKLKVRLTNLELLNRLKLSQLRTHSSRVRHPSSSVGYSPGVLAA